MISSVLFDTAGKLETIAHSILSSSSFLWGEGGGGGGQDSFNKSQ